MRKLDGTMPLASPECTPSREDLDAQIADDRAAQRRRHPELVVVAAAAVEADHQPRRADPLREEIDVRGQIERAALLAALDDDDDARVRAALLLHRLDGGDGGEDGVAVVRAAAAVELLRRAAPESTGRGPSHPTMAGCLSRWPYIRTVDESSPSTSMKMHRRASFSSLRLRLQPCDLAALPPSRGRSATARSMWPFAFQSGSKSGRLVGDADVVAQRRQDAGLPDSLTRVRVVVASMGGMVGENNLPMVGKYMVYGRRW